MRTRLELQEFIASELSDSRFLVVSNREPYVHTMVGKEVKCIMPAGGVTTALDPVMQACGGTWIAHGAGDGDWEVADERGRVAIPPEDPTYTLRRVKLTRDQEQGYYYGFSNGALWPLCHVAYTKPTFKESDWKEYAEVNGIFANSVLDEVGDKKALVFVQDYHLALVPHILKQQNPDLVVAQFWHIPWPDKEIMRICPWQMEIVEGLLGNDLLGFHIRQHCQNFMDSVSGTLGGKISRTRQEIRNGDRRTQVLPFPISVDFDEISRNSEGDEVDREVRRLKETYKLSSDFIIVGLDRIDYTKGIPERFRALDQFLQRYSWYRGRVVLVQVGAPSRTDIGVYRRLNEEIEGLAEEINERHGSDQWQPVVNIAEQCAPITLAALRRMATAAVVTPLHDGMNLVAKEFVASRNDDDGVLILSCFAGAAEEMTDALLVNPYATEHLADTYKRALEMPRRERRTRMRRMRRVVQERNIYGWAADIIAQMISLKPGR